MGVRTTIVIYASNESVATAGAADAFDAIAKLEDVLSDWRVDSEVAHLSAKSGRGPIPASAALRSTLKKALRVAAASEGAFDPTVGPLVKSWRAARIEHRLPTAVELERDRAAVDWRKVRIDDAGGTVELALPDMQLDLGGIGKGLAAEAALDRLRARGLSHAMVALSGDVACGAAPPGRSGWSIAVPSIVDANSNQSAVLELVDRAVSTSGDAEQFVEFDGHRYSHIVDPHTGLGLEHATTVTVVAPHGADADALATAACVLGPERALQLFAAFPDCAAVMVEPGDRGGARHVVGRASELVWRGDGPRP